MTARKPVVIVDGELKQLPDGDTIVGASGGSTALKGTDWVNWCYNTMASSLRFRTDKKDFGSGTCFFFPIRDSEFSGTIARLSGNGFAFTSGTAGAGLTLPMVESTGLAITTGTATTSPTHPTLTCDPGLPDKNAAGGKQQITDVQDSITEVKLTIPAALSNSSQRYVVDVYAMYASAFTAYAVLSYTDNVNSGNWQLSYLNEAGTLINVDTGIAAVANTQYIARFRAVWNSSTSKFELTVSIGAFSTTLTSLRMNFILASAASIRAQLTIRKTVGTTATVLRLRDACVIVGLK